MKKNKKKIDTKEFDKKFEAGEDISQFLDLETAIKTENKITRTPKIRPILNTDVARVNQIVREVFDEYGMTLDLVNTDKSLLSPHIYNAETEIFFVAEQDERVVGCVLVDIKDSVAESHKLYIDVL